MLVVATSFAKQFRLKTGAFGGMVPLLDRRSNIEKLILGPRVPSLGGKIRRRAILG